MNFIDSKILEQLRQRALIISEDLGIWQFEDFMCYLRDEDYPILGGEVVWKNIYVI